MITIPLVDPELHEVTSQLTVGKFSKEGDNIQFFAGIRSPNKPLANPDVIFNVNLSDIKQAFKNPDTVNDTNFGLKIILDTTVFVFLHLKGRENILRTRTYTSDSISSEFMLERQEALIVLGLINLCRENSPKNSL